MATLLVMAVKEESQSLFEKEGINPQYCGIGQLNAAFCVQKLIHEQKPERILNLGTAGSLNLEKGKLVECTSFVQRRPHATSVSSAPIEIAALTDLPKARCGTGDFIEKTGSTVPCDLMDMEAYAMAFVCAKLNVKFNCIKYISDSTGDFREWSRMLPPAAKELLTIYKKLEPQL